MEDNPQEEGDEAIPPVEVEIKRAEVALAQYTSASAAGEDQGDAPFREIAANDNGFTLRQLSEAFHWLIHRAAMRQKVSYDSKGEYYSLGAWK